MIIFQFYWLAKPYWMISTTEKWGSPQVPSKLFLPQSRLSAKWRYACERKLLTTSLNYWRYTHVLTSITHSGRKGTWRIIPFSKWLVIMVSKSSLLSTCYVGWASKHLQILEGFQGIKKKITPGDFHCEPRKKNAGYFAWNPGCLIETLLGHGYYNPHITGQYNPFINLFKDLQDLKRDESGESGVAPSQWQMKVYRKPLRKREYSWWSLLLGGGHTQGMRY